MTRPALIFAAALAIVAGLWAYIDTHADLIAATALWPAITPPTREWDDYADHLEGPL